MDRWEGTRLGAIGEGVFGGGNELRPNGWWVDEEGTVQAWTPERSVFRRTTRTLDFYGIAGALIHT